MIVTEYNGVRSEVEAVCVWPELDILITQKVYHPQSHTLYNGIDLNIVDAMKLVTELQAAIDMHNKLTREYYRDSLIEEAAKDLINATSMP